MESRETNGEAAAGGAGPLDPASLDIDDEAGESRPLVLVAQFFLIPLLVVAVAVAVFLLFGLATRERHTPRESLQEVRTGSLNRRWQSAYELSMELARHPELARDEALFAETLQTFEGAGEQPEVRRYLALALGRFARREAVPALIEALADPDEETRLYAALALGAVGDPAAAAPLGQLLRDELPSLRKGAAYALGTLRARDAIPALRVTAEDRQLDVALQGALSLAQMGDASGLPTLRKGIDRKVLSAALEMKPVQQSDAVMSAVQGLVLAGDRESLPALDRLAREDPDLRVRDAALRAAEALRR